MNGFTSNNNSMTGTENKNIDVIYNRSLTTTNINSGVYNGIPKQDLLYLSGLNANVQQQINALSTNINSGGGGALYCLVNLQPVLILVIIMVDIGSMVQLRLVILD